MITNEPLIRERDIRKSRTKGQKVLVSIIIAVFAAVGATAFFLTGPAKGQL